MQVGIWVRLEPQLCQVGTRGFGSNCTGQDLGQNAQGWIWVGVYRDEFGSDCTGQDLGQTAQCRIWVRLHRAGSGQTAQGRIWVRCTGSGLSHNDVRLGHEDLGQTAQGRTWVRPWLRLVSCLVKDRRRVWVTCQSFCRRVKKRKERKTNKVDCCRSERRSKHKSSTTTKQQKETHTLNLS